MLFLVVSVVPLVSPTLTPFLLASFVKGGAEERGGGIGFPQKHGILAISKLEKGPKVEFVIMESTILH